MGLHGVLYHVPRAERRRRIDEFLAFVELRDRRDALVKTFSSGMRRRLEIARGLLHRPAVLFLDEPTLGLDTQTRNRMWDCLKDRNIRDGTTIFFTTHYMDEAERIADRIAIIDHGRIVAMGSPDDLKRETECDSLEDAFLALTGNTIRDEAPAKAGAGVRRLWQTH